MSSENNLKIERVRSLLLEACSVLSGMKTTETKGVVPVNRFLRLMAKDNWVPAVPPSLLMHQDCDRSRGLRYSLVLDRFLEREIRGGRFLDLSCGLGDLAYAALEWGISVSVGYDVVRGGWGRFPSRDNLVFTTDMGVVKESGPYDCVFLFDNCLTGHSDPITTLDVAKSLLCPSGLLYVRLFPWSSRYGMGDVRRLNKAFGHLFLSPEELGGFGLTKSRFSVTRTSEYREWFKMAGLSVRREVLTRDIVEPVFKTPLMAEKLKEVLGVLDFPEEILSVSCVDYVLECRK